MSLSDKISWVGGMMGLFTGFSVISGIEILYWLWFKVLLHRADKVGPEQEKEGCQDCHKLREEFKGLKNEMEELRMNMKSVHHAEDPKAGLYFDAIFNDVESQQVDQKSSHSVLSIENQ